MERQFFFHGNPSNGESTAKNIFDGLEEKVRDDFFKFVSNKDASPYLLCEIRRWKNTFYSIYSYYHDGRDYENRPNGHCVLTLVVKNQYCRRTIDLYNLMVVIYKRGLQETLHYIDESGRFMIRTFYGMEQLDYLGNDFYRNIDENTFANIDNDFQTSSGNEIELFNPLDVDSQCFFDSLRKNGKVIVTENVMSYNQQVVSLQSKVDRIEVIESNLQTANSQIERLKEENRELSQKQSRNQVSAPVINRSEIDTLAAENKRLKEELAILKSKKNGGATEAVSINQDKTNVSVDRESSRGQGSLLDQAKKTISDWFQIATLILLLICVVGVYVKKPSKTELPILTNIASDSDGDNSDESNIESNFAQMKETSDFLKEAITHQMFADAHKAPKQNININIVSKGDELQVGKYGKKSKIELSNPNLIIGLTPSKGKWIFSGCCTKLSNDSVLFGPTSTQAPESAKIEYEYNGIIVLQRTVIVKR
ncbi:MAG: cell division protein ZapB [Prevotella sp.]